MLYLLVAFIALTAIRQWNPLFSPQAAIHRSNDRHPSTYARHSHHNMATCTMYDSFPNLDLALDINSMGSNWHFSYTPTGLKTHTVGCMTHTASDTAVGHVTQHPFYVSSIRYHYHLMHGQMTSRQIFISCKRHHNITTSSGITNELSYPSHQCHQSSCLHSVTYLKRLKTIQFYLSHRVLIL